MPWDNVKKSGKVFLFVVKAFIANMNERHAIIYMNYRKTTSPPSLVGLTLAVDKSSGEFCRESVIWA